MVSRNGQGNLLAQAKAFAPNCFNCAGSLVGPIKLEEDQCWVVPYWGSGRSIVRHVEFWALCNRKAVPKYVSSRVGRVP